VNVLFTLVVFAVAAAWVLVAVRRLTQLREQVKLAWKRLEPDQSNEAVKSVYNKHVTIYNDALGAFPANLVGPASGFKPAKHF
jgi:hypothetical protein